ncbi:MAG TPA: hypothetical protein PLY36_16395 [Spirochaetota bacterium]|nr:hypothetical protein [Spirochaetota bacterium]
MKKILIIAIIAIFSLIIYANEESKVEGLNYYDLINSLDKVGLEYEVQISSTVFTTEKSMTIKEFIDKLENINGTTNGTKSLTYLVDNNCDQLNFPWYHCDADFYGTSWDGVRHRLHHRNNTDYWNAFNLDNPDSDVYSYTYASTSGLQDCAQEYSFSSLWIPGVGSLPGHWVTIRVYVGNEICTNVYFNA